MPRYQFTAFRPDLDPAQTVMIDGHAPGFRMISHWPGHGTPEGLRHDLTTGSAFLFAEMSDAERRGAMGEFSIVTNNHYDADGALSLYTMLEPEIALKHRDLMLCTAAAGDFANWGGADALALELSVMSDLSPFMPFSTPPHDSERLGNLARAYERIFDRMEALLTDPFMMREHWQDRHRQVVADISRIERGEGINVTRYSDDDLAVVETDRRITLFGLHLVAGDLYRVLLVMPVKGGHAYRFHFRGETWWDVVTTSPMPRKPLKELAERLNELEGPSNPHWWATPIDWVVPELGYGEAPTFRHQAVRFDPRIDLDPTSQLPVDLVVDELRVALQTYETYTPVATTVQDAD